MVFKLNHHNVSELKYNKTNSGIGKSSECYLFIS